MFTNSKFYSLIVSVKLALESGLRRCFAKRWIYIFTINCAASATATILLLVTKPETNWSALGLILARAFIYSNCIGLPVAASVDYLLARLSSFPLILQPPVLLGAIIAQTIVGCWVASVIGVLGRFIPEHEVWTAFHSVLPVALVLSIVFSSVGILYSLLYTRMENATLQLQAKELERERTAKLAAEAKLNLLEAHLRPHFIFNTLNTIAALVREDSRQAERTIEQFANILRSTLYTDRLGTVTLRDEFELVADYLTIEKVRFGDCFQYQIDLPPELEEVRVPALAVQTLAENSIKHAVVKQFGASEICVAAQAVGKQVSITVSDSGAGFASDAIIDGHGLANLRARLKILFDDRAALKIRRDDDRTSVTVWLPRLS